MALKPINEGTMSFQFPRNSNETKALGCRMLPEPRISMPVGIGADELADNLKSAGVEILA